MDLGHDRTLRLAIVKCVLPCNSCLYDIKTELALWKHIEIANWASLVLHPWKKKYCISILMSTTYLNALTDLLDCKTPRDSVTQRCDS